MAKRKGGHDIHISTKWGIAILGFFLITTLIIVAVLDQSQSLQSQAALDKGRGSIGSVVKTNTNNNTNNRNYLRLLEPFRINKEYLYLYSKADYTGIVEKINLSKLLKECKNQERCCRNIYPGFNDKASSAKNTSSKVHITLFENRDCGQNSGYDKNHNLIQGSITLKPINEYPHMGNYDSFDNINQYMDNKASSFSITSY